MMKAENNKTKVEIKNIEAIFHDIKIYVDGILFEDEKLSKSAKPYISEGSVYIPLDTVASIMKKEVEWNGETKSIYIGDKPENVVLLTEVSPPYDGVSYYNCCDLYDKFFKMNGVKYTNGVVLGETIDESFALFNLNGKYNTLTAEIGHVDNSEEMPKEVMIIVDGKCVRSYDIYPDEPPVKIKIDLKQGLKLKILATEGISLIGVANISVR